MKFQYGMQRFSICKGVARKIFEEPNFSIPSRQHERGNLSNYYDELIRTLSKRLCKTACGTNIQANRFKQINLVIQFLVVTNSKEVNET